MPLLAYKWYNCYFVTGVDNLGLPHRSDENLLPKTYIFRHIPDTINTSVSVHNGKIGQI